MSGANFVLPDKEWDTQPGNILVQTPALPLGPLNAADINIVNMNLNYHTTAVNRETSANLLCTKYSSVLQYVKSALLSRAFTIDQEAHSTLIRNRITNLPGRLEIPPNQILANLWDHYGTPNEAPKFVWETVFDTPRYLKVPILNYLSQ